MNVFLEELNEVNNGQKMVIIMDGAGWHKSEKLIIPNDIRTIILPPYSPELNPTEKLWQYIKSGVNIWRDSRDYDEMDKRL